MLWSRGCIGGLFLAVSFRWVLMGNGGTRTEEDVLDDDGLLS